MGRSQRFLFCIIVPIRDRALCYCRGLLGETACPNFCVIQKLLGELSRGLSSYTFSQVFGVSFFFFFQWKMVEKPTAFQKQYKNVLCQQVVVTPDLKSGPPPSWLPVFASRLSPLLMPGASRSNANTFGNNTLLKMSFWLLPRLSGRRWRAGFPLDMNKEDLNPSSYSGRFRVWKKRLLHIGSSLCSPLPKSPRAAAHSESCHSSVYALLCCC